ncbi:MAG: hypothetical protein IPP17_25350 [Bacteroidetes bacterium]|nr:hypothetical protein [Bacteroidota bacterium]
MTTPVDTFEDVPLLDNFYQTSSFFPMPVVLVGTLAEDGQTNLGPYSLCFPHIISGKHSMMLIARGNSKYRQAIFGGLVCDAEFHPDDRDFMENCVYVGFSWERPH